MFMFASEMIARLQLLIEEYGDLRVLQADDGGVSDIRSVELLAMDDIEPVLLISNVQPSGAI